eukprot:GCRY01001608.1.p1 GENE.GCRY01001608.1~~GCRY01001608.1.p1  ORF type:complete len:744 (-),score=53.63 GCRY01001608.1:376-2607(-)
MSRLLISGIILTCFAIIFTGCGFLFRYSVIPSIVDSGIKNGLVIDEGDFEDRENPFEEDDTPNFSTYYLFNLSNYDNFINHGHPPRVEEYGPFVYRKYKSFKNQSLSEDGNLYSYKNRYEYVFQPDVSASPDLEIINLNQIYQYLYSSPSLGGGKESTLGVGIGTKIVSSLLSLLKQDSLKSLLLILQGADAFYSSDLPLCADSACISSWAAGAFPGHGMSPTSLQSLYGGLKTEALSTTLAFVQLGLSSSASSVIEHSFGISEMSDQQLVSSWIQNGAAAKAVVSYPGNDVVYYTLGSGISIGGDPVTIKMLATSAGLSLNSYYPDFEIPRFYANPSYSYSADDSSAFFQYFFEHVNASLHIGSFLNLYSSHASGSPFYPTTTIPQMIAAGYLSAVVNMDANCVKCFAGAELKLAIENGAGLFCKHTAREWIDGWTDPLYGTKWGILSNTTDAVFERTGLSIVQTGENDLDDIQQYVQYEGSNMLDFWKELVEIVGTPGVQFSPKLGKEDVLTVYETTLRRSIPLVYSSDSQVRGFDTYAFSIKPEFLYNYTANPSNALFDQAYTGLVNHTVHGNGPYLMSKPHMLDVDRYYQDRTMGLHPDVNLHDTTLDLFPRFGTVFSGNMRVQTNIMISPTDVNYKNVPNDVLLPIYWLEMTASMTESQADDLNDMLDTEDLFLGIATVFIVLGLVLLVPGGGMILLSQRKLYTAVYPQSQLAKSTELSQASPTEYETPTRVFSKPKP